MSRHLIVVIVKGTMIWEKCLPRSRNSEHKGPKVEACVVYWGNSKEVSVVGAELSTQNGEK